MRESAKSTHPDRLAAPMHEGATRFKRAAKGFAILAGVAGLFGVSGCAVAIAVANNSSDPYRGIGVGAFGLLALAVAGAALVVAGILAGIGKMMERA